MSEADSTKVKHNSSEEEGDQKVEEVETTPEPVKQGARKAQRTKRVNVTPGQMSSAAKNSENCSKEKPAMSNDDEREVCATIREEEDEEGGDDVAKVIEGLVRVAGRALRTLITCVTCVCRLLARTLSLVRRGLGVLFSAAIFVGVAYLIGTYVMTPVSERDVISFEARLKFLLRFQVWPMLPVFLAAVAGMVRTDNKVHKVFGQEAFEQALFSLFNLLLLATHLHSSYLLWVGACVVTAAVFNLLHWMCLVYTTRQTSLFSSPISLLNISVMAVNLYVIFGQNLGYVAMTPEAEVDLSPEVKGRPSYWNHVTMCHLVEQMFCKP